jgi:hypothetical protein
MQLKAQLRAEAANKPKAAKRKPDTEDALGDAPPNTRRKRGAVSDTSKQQNERELRGFLLV